MLNLKREKKDINGLTFETQQFAAMKASHLFMRLAKTIGPALGALFKLDPNTELESAGMELTAAFASLDADDAVRLIPAILESTNVTVEGKHIALNTASNIDLVFSGEHLRTLYQAIGFALQVNYRDFISGGSPAPSLHSGHKGS